MDKIKKIISPIKNDMDIFENELKNIVLSCDNFLKDDLMNFMFSTQKRLRPILTLLFSKILNIQSEIVLKIMLAQEIFHSASLIHDDIIDEAELRRNQKTFYSKYNSKIAVLEGDLLLSLGLKILSQTNIEILKIFSDKILNTIQGELEQNSNLNKITDEKTYINKNFNKTGNLFLCGLEALFTLGEFDFKLKENLKNFLINYSIAFQLKNDIKDFKQDYKNGNYTLIMLYFLKENNIEDLNKKDISKYIDEAKIKLEEYKKTAQDYIKMLNSKYQIILLEIIKTTLEN